MHPTSGSLLVASPFHVVGSPSEIHFVKAAILAVGTELLGVDRLDTNSLRLTEALRRFGVELVRKGVVGDDEEEIAADLERLTASADVVLVSGGLGPTADDVTREAVARLTSRAIRVEEAILHNVRERFRRLERPLPAVNRKQAEVLEGAEILKNRRGIAPGQRIEHGQSQIFLFPGVPGELQALVDDALVPWLRARMGDDAASEERELKVACLPESAVEELVAPAYEEFGRSDISVLAAAGEVKLRIRSSGPAAARTARLDAMSARLAELVGDALYSTGEVDSLEELVGRMLRRAGATVATGESCTGGLVAERLTRIPGSSDYFLGSVVAYTSELKTSLLGVAEDLMATAGSVSQPVAEAMAEGARRRLASTYAFGVTGIAGPGGGTDEKPVGTVHVALAGPVETAPAGAGGGVEHRRYILPFDRERVRWITSQFCLDLLRRRLLAVPESSGELG